MKVGIVGMPNAGKSSLFNALTSAGAEAANYPFTTVDPNVAVVLMSGYASLFPKFATTEQRFPLLTKPFTAVMLLQLVHAGAIRLSDPVDRFFPNSQATPIAAL